MTPQQFATWLKENERQLLLLMRDKLPSIAGVEAVQFFRNNYRKGGFMDAGFHAWPITKRQQEGGRGASSKYSPLLSKRNRLWSSITFRAGIGEVTIYTDVPYAKIHNEGGDIRVPITQRMRKYFWAMYYANGGNPKSKRQQKADKWKWMALNKNKSMKITIPQRKFLYKSNEVTQLVKDVVKREVKKIMR